MPTTSRCNFNKLPGCILGLLFPVLFWPFVGDSAEILGSVSAKHTGLFAPNSTDAVPGGISVSISPLDGQPLPAQQPRVHQVHIHNKTFMPVFLTIQRGDQLQFVNQDPLFHKLFSLSQIRPFSIEMGKVDDAAKPLTSDLYTFQEVGLWHVFCRIHSMMYFRVDVVETPYYTTIKEGGKFHFTGLATGRWKIRVAAIGSEPLELTTDAITAPPPLEIVLPVKSGAGLKNTSHNHEPTATDVAAGNHQGARQ